MEDPWNESIIRAFRPYVSHFGLYHRFQNSLPDKNKCSGLESTFISERAIAVASLCLAETPESWSSSKSMGGAGACLALRDNGGQSSTHRAAPLPGLCSLYFQLFGEMFVWLHFIFLQKRFRFPHTHPGYPENTILTSCVLLLLSNLSVSVSPTQATCC